MLEANKQLIHRWFEEVWNKGRAEAIEEMFDENGIAHGLSDDPAHPIRGPRGYRPFYDTLRHAFPNIIVVVEDTVAEGDKVAARCSVRGKHEGEFLADQRLKLQSSLPASRSFASKTKRSSKPGTTSTS